MENKYIDFKKIAKETLALSPIMTNRDKVDMDKIIEDYPDGVTITDFDFVTIGEDTFPVCVIKENPNIFFFGGLILFKILQSYVKRFDGDVGMTSDTLSIAGGVKFRFEHSRTREGNRITTVSIV